MGFEWKEPWIDFTQLKHIRFREKYAEDEVPHEAKTGSGPILLTMSFPCKGLDKWTSF